MRTMRSRTRRLRRAVTLLVAPLIALTALTYAPATPASAVAGDIVLNGGFETVSGADTSPVFADWTYSGGFRTSGGYVSGNYNPHTGAHAFLAMNPANITLEQVLTTSPGTTYDLGFWHSSVIGTSLTAAVVQGGATTTLGSYGGTGYYGPVNPPYAEHTGLSFTASGTSVTLRFVLNDPGGYAGWLVTVDDVSVVPQSTGPTVPEAPVMQTVLRGDSQVTLMWTAPADGGAEITGYTVAYKVAAETTWSAPMS